jgi:diguanylate cyclase (GGDEF)-like protein
MTAKLSLKRSVILSLLAMLIGLGFLATTLSSYYTSRAALRENIIGTELPLVSNAVYGEVRNDLVRPVQVARALSSDVFLHDWITRGERDPKLLSRFLGNIREQNHTTSAFFVSQRSQTYYDQDGVFEHMEPGHGSSAWFYQFRDSGAPWEVVIDPARRTMFVNCRVNDDQGRFAGVVGIGITVEQLLLMIENYQRVFDRTLYVVDANRQLVLTGATGQLAASKGLSIDRIPALAPLGVHVQPLRDGTFDYAFNGEQHYVNVRFIAELNWYLLVDRHDADLMKPVRRTLWVNLLVCLAVTTLVLGFVGWVTRRYLLHIEALTLRDPLTGLLNRRGFSLLAEQALLECQRDGRELSVMMIDLDHFKSINDTHGHLGGDSVLRAFSGALTASMRASDIISRWGGEEFILVLKAANSEAARALAEKIRSQAQSYLVDHGGELLSFTVSIGLAQSKSTDTLEEVIDLADQALYLAKRGGRNRVCASEDRQ